jgi:hypothetical protein
LSFVSERGVCNLTAMPSATQTWRFQSLSPEDSIQFSEETIRVRTHCAGPVDLELSRSEVSDPRVCTVKTERAAFSDPDTGVERSAYVVHDDSVETAPYFEPGKWLARFRSKSGRTLGLLDAKTLDCR